MSTETDFPAAKKITRRKPLTPGFPRARWISLATTFLLVSTISIIGAPLRRPL
jgi:hypothetical protein